MPDPIPIPKHSPWVTQFLVIRALFSREVASRFGQYRLGFFWLLFEPLLGTVVIGLVVGPIAGRTVPEMPYAFFLLNGFLLLKLFTSPMNAGVNAITANQGLLVYPSVRPLDPLLARFIYDLITTMFSFSLFCVIGMWVGITLSLDNLHVILAAYLITWLCGCGFGLLFGVASAYYNEMEKIVRVIQRPLIFVSAVLFPSSVLSRSVREILFFNPLVHTIELSRNALFPDYYVAGANLFYPFSFGIIVFSLGIAYFHNNRNYLSQL
jgi:capsular polysaccharide transport system permease protein